MQNPGIALHEHLELDESED